MSHENVAIVRRAYEAFNRGDVDAVIADLGSDFEYVASGAIPGFGGAYRGPEGFKRWMSWLLDEFDDVRIDVDELMDAGDHVLVGATDRGRGKQSGAEVSWRVWQLWTMRDSKILRGQGFMSKEEALEAMSPRGSAARA